MSDHPNHASDRERTEDRPASPPPAAASASRGQASDPVVVPPVPREILAEIAGLGVVLEDGDAERLRTHLQLLLEENRRVNLTAIRDPAEAWRRHALDALSLVGPLASLAGPPDRPLRVADLGSGGGMPGLVLACVMPEVEFTLVEATGKKARFLERAADALGLANVAVRAVRAETLGRDEACRERFDAVLARAVAPLRVLLELAMPLLRTRGVLLAVKGARASEEIEAARKALHALHAVVVSDERTATGTIVVVEKSRPTPRRYPRPPGVPAGRPL